MRNISAGGSAGRDGFGGDSLGAHTDLWRDGGVFEHGRQARAAAALPPMPQGWGTRSERQARSRPCDWLVTRCAHRWRRTRFERGSRAASHVRRERSPSVSTGTWVISWPWAGRDKLDPNADMLASVDVRGEPVPTARFMAAVNTRPCRDRPADATKPNGAGIVASGALALPAFLDRAARSPRARRHRRRGAGDAKSACCPRDSLLGADDAHMLRRLEAPGDSSSKAASPARPRFPRCSRSHAGPAVVIAQ